MKMKTLVSIAGLAAGLVLLAGCASTPNHATPLSKEQILLQPDVKDKPPVIFQKGLEEVRLAGLRALTFVGCEVKTQEPLFLSGRRPNKVGFFVGSGGETVKIFLYPQSDSETHVWVDTDLSFIGLAGQQGWNKQVIEEMTNILNKTTTGSSQ
ncbi:MAG: hypothetical protein ABSG80_02040 [Verrucomicrobiota bacterium]|jgi:hypothetical protein